MDKKEINELSHLKITSLDDKGKKIDVSEDVKLGVFVDKPDFLLKITGNLEIVFDDNFKALTHFEIEAKTVEILIKKLLIEITKTSLSKLNEALQFLTEKRSEDNGF